MEVFAAVDRGVVVRGVVVRVVVVRGVVARAAGLRTGFCAAAADSPSVAGSPAGAASADAAVSVVFFVVVRLAAGFFTVGVVGADGAGDPEACDVPPSSCASFAGADEREPVELAFFVVPVARAGDLRAGAFFAGVAFEGVAAGLAGCASREAAPSIASSTPSTVAAPAPVTPSTPVELAGRGSFGSSGTFSVGSGSAEVTGQTYQERGATAR